MKFVTVLALLAFCIATTTSAQQYSMQPSDSNGTFASKVSTFIVEAIGRAIRFLFEVFDIKVRSVRFLSSLYTTDNLVLLKKIMHIGLRFANWLYETIPNSTTEGQNNLLSFLFPQVNLENQNLQNQNYENQNLENQSMENGSDEGPDLNDFHLDSDDLVPENELTMEAGKLESYDRVRGLSNLIRARQN